MRKNRLLLLLILPSFLGVLFFYVLPFLLTIIYSITEKTKTGTILSFTNFFNALSNPMFQLGILNFLHFALIAIPAICIISLSLAFALKKINYGFGFLTFALLLPFVTPSGATAFFWNCIFGVNGFINRVLFQNNINLVMWDSSEWSMLIPVIIYIWKYCGFLSIVFYIGLNNIPNEYYEVAQIEGASAGKIFFKITLVYLSPTMFISTLLAFISTFKISKELFMLFGNYPSSNLYLFQHFINNQFSSMNLSILCSASLAVISFVCLSVIFLWSFQRKLSDTFANRGEYNLKVYQKRTNHYKDVFLVIILSTIILFPILFTLGNSFMSSSEVISRYSSSVIEQNINDLSRNGLHFVNPSLIPSVATFSQYFDFIREPTYLRMFWNSVIIIIPIISAHLIVSVLGAFAIFRIKAKYINFLFIIYMILMVIPLQVMITPQYVFFKSLNATNSFLPIILPAIFNPIGVYIIRLQLQGFPKECIEAAQVSGASEMAILKKIILPNIRGSIIILIVYAFAEYWNTVDQAVVFISNYNYFPLSVSLSNIMQTDIGIMFSGSSIYLLPPCLMFIICMLELKRSND